jgi:hypothetical protein
MRCIPGPGQKCAGRHGNQTNSLKGADMDLLQMLSYLRAQVVRALIAFVVFLVLFKYVLPLIIREVKNDLLVIIIILYLLFMASLKIWPVW